MQVNETFEFTVKFIARCLGPHWAVYQIHDQTGDPIGKEIRMDFTVVEQTYEQKVQERVPKSAHEPGRSSRNSSKCHTQSFS